MARSPDPPDSRRRILYIQYTNPGNYPPLEHSAHILAREGWNVLFVGTSKPEEPLQIQAHSRINVKRIAFCPAGWRQKFHYVFFSLWASGWAILFRPQWIYASDPLASLPAWIGSSLVGVRVVYHEHDSPGADGQEDAAVYRSSFKQLVLWMRKELMRRAQILIWPNRERIEPSMSGGGEDGHIFCVWNCPSRGEVLPPRVPWKGGGFRLLYHGSIVPGRLPQVVLEALTALPEFVKLRIIGFETAGSKGYIHQLQAVAARLCVEQRVELVGILPTRVELLRSSTECDVGLSLMPRRAQDVNLHWMVGASNKPFDYLACGLALLVSDLPEWKKAYVEPGYGLACDPDDPASIAQAIRWFLEHPDQMRAMGERGRQRILEEWNYERQFAPIFEQLEKVFGECQEVIPHG